ncbi:hypothetical protein NDU88_001819 [Pleurodeles waltl]|uniref:Uncharacterized protein n=1 Tax=Pleurodeles waltl TaxID=8319 RepID=A0AAV7WNV8_PLEWA|nr:hypothetical protein NDU88_001819 [Pleurodeles waltl]
MNDVRGNTETEKQLRTNPKIQPETPRRNGESRHVPEGPWHPQKPANLFWERVPDHSRPSGRRGTDHPSERPKGEKSTSLPLGYKRRREG